MLSFTLADKLYYLFPLNGPSPHHDMSGINNDSPYGAVSDLSMNTDAGNGTKEPLLGTTTCAPPTSCVAVTAEAPSSATVETAVYRRRWAILILFSVSLLVNQAQYCSFATINKETMAYFETSNLGATMLTAVFSAVYIVFIVPMCIFYDRLGFYRGILLAGATNALCGAFKLLGAFYPYYGLIMVGQIFGGLSQLFSLSIPPLLAAIWFPTAERSLATSLGTLSGFLGIAYSFYFSPLIIDNQPDKEHFAPLLGSEFGAAVLCFVLALLIVRDKPPKPPSVTARASSGMPPSVRECLGLFAAQFRNFSLVRLWLAFGLANGTVTALSTVLSSMLLPYGVSEGRTGTIVSVAIVAGCVAAPIVALTLDKLRNYKRMLTLLYAFSTLSVAGAALVITLDVEYLYTACFFLIVLSQITLLPAIPVAMEFSVEKTYPTPEVVASSLCLVHLCVFAVGGSVAFSSILDDDAGKGDARLCIWVCVGVIVSALLLVLTVREDRFRYDHEQSVAAAADEAAVPAIGDVDGSKNV